MKPYFVVSVVYSCFATLGLMALGAVPARASLIAFDMDGITANGGNVYAPGVGFRFTVGPDPLQVDALSCALWVSDWNAGTSSSANLDVQDVRVKLWRASDQALLAEVRLTSADYAGPLTPTPANYTFRYFREAVTGFQLGGGEAYIVALYGTTNTGGSLQYINNLHNAARPVTVAPDLVFANGNLYTPGATPGAIPSVADSSGNPKFGGPSFEYKVVPEPAAAGLLYVGALSLRALRRRGRT